MKVYVLSFSDNHDTYIVGVFTSNAKAMIHMTKNMDIYDDHVLDYDSDIVTWRFFTELGTYVIEKTTLDEPDADY